MHENLSTGLSPYADLYKTNTLRGFEYGFLECLYRWTQKHAPSALDELSLDDIRFLIRKFPIGKNFEYKLRDGIVSVPYDVQARYEHHTGKTNFVIQFCPKDFENTTFYIAFNANILPTDMLDFDKRSLSTSEYDNLEYKNMGHDKLKKVCVPFLTPKYFRNAYIVYQGGDARCNDSVTSQNIIDMILNN